ncbi:hypothetical protein LTR70_001573 [Exophiala xenobiotica]|uniref:NmrA-like domain-containing protein n=1 Tax=Lithohypha guttulata TaxID=1690604 RepID=A0ABR0KD71_9EURO|nr:hypothetical protein LTR24_003980 [Lithohypha guttulata]KAK5327950.1 hypothetical protein LTR70_001573 [Exophiala xenobiotica]
MPSNQIRNVAIVGATGRQGKHIIEHLLTAGKHTLTAITREDSSATPVPGVKVAKVNYDNQDSLVSALKGQDALIITMSVTAPPDTSEKLIRAAAKAEVPWILPDEWGIDGTNEQYGKDCFLGPPKKAVRDLIEELAVSSWVAIACGFWYQYSLGTSKDLCGFDFQKREITFYDDGTTKINMSTWEQVARAVTALLSMDVAELDARFKNKFAYVSSFCISQKDIFESVKRVTGTSDGGWKIEYQPSSERVAEGMKAMQEGEGGPFAGFAKMLYGRSFYPNGDGNFEAKHGLVNELLGLPKDDLDECTKGAIELSNNIAKEGK